MNYSDFTSRTPPPKLPFPFDLTKIIFTTVRKFPWASFILPSETFAASWLPPRSGFRPPLRRFAYGKTWGQ